jgi:hypothetical protein
LHPTFVITNLIESKWKFSLEIKIDDSEFEELQMSTHASKWQRLGRSRELCLSFRNGFQKNAAAGTNMGCGTSLIKSVRIHLLSIEKSFSVERYHSFPLLLELLNLYTFSLISGLILPQTHHVCTAIYTLPNHSPTRFS